MKKVFYILFCIVTLVILIKSFMLQDGDNIKYQQMSSSDISDITYPSKPINVVLEGKDFLQVQSPVGKFGGNLVISTIGEGPKTFNPCNAKDATSASMAGLLYDGLLTTDSVTGEVIPLLAKEFQTKGNEYLIKLRHGICWSDGVAITADDVMYTYNEIVFKGLGNTATRDAMMINGVLPKLEKLDNYTVKFTTSKTFAPFLRQLSYPIVPKHYFKAYSDKGESVFNAFLSPNTPPKQIVSNGAFLLKEYVAAQRVVFVRNPNYYKINLNNEKLPYLDKLIYLIVGDTNNEILKFEAKELDVLNIHGANVARYKIKEQNSDYKIYDLGADTGTLFLVINLNNRKNKEGKWNVSPIKQKWFANRDFRAAIDWAIDRKAMVQNVAQGVAVPLYTAESLNSIYLNKYIKGHSKDFEVAKKSLEKAGFSLKNNVLYDKEGHQVEFDLYTNAGVLERESIGVIIKQDLEELGMKVNFKPIEFNTLVNKLAKTCDWDMAIMGLTGSPLEPHDGKNVWVSGGPLHLFNQRPQDYGIDDRLDWEIELDKIFDEGALKLDYNDRKCIYDKYQTIIYNQKPIIYLYSPVRIFAIRKKFKNIYPSTLSGLVHNPEEIYIEKGIE